MDKALLRRLRSRFVRLAGEHADRLGERRAHILLKRDHSLRVHALAVRIVNQERLAPARVFLSAALLHDIGRFSQFERFGTYRDDQSVDHGDEGARVLAAGGFLDGFAEAERVCITNVVRLHNKRELPDGLDPQTESVCSVVRDADKLDIVPVVLSKMMPGGPRDGVVTLGLADEPDAWSEAVAATVLAGESPSYATLRYVNDFKLLLASWGPGLVHGASRRMYAGRGFLDRLFDLLPPASQLAGLKTELAARLAR